MDTRLTAKPSRALLLETASDLLAVLTLFALALSAVALAKATLDGRPFSRAVTRGVSVAAIAVLIVALASELIRWAARVVILDEMESTAFSRDLSFDPLVITVGLALAVVATAFRFGERLQRDTEGLV